MLRTAGRHADQALIWATAGSDLDRVSDVIGESAADRSDGGPEMVWAPLTALPDDREADVTDVAIYAVLNAGPGVLERWGLDGDVLERIRRAVVAGTAAQRAVWCPTPYWETSCSAAPMPTPRQWRPGGGPPG